MLFFLFMSMSSTMSPTTLLHVYKQSLSTLWLCKTVKLAQGQLTAQESGRSTALHTWIALHSWMSMLPTHHVKPFIPGGPAVLISTLLCMQVTETWHDRQQCRVLLHVMLSGGDRGTQGLKETGLTLHIVQVAAPPQKLSYLHTTCKAQQSWWSCGLAANVTPHHLLHSKFKPSLPGLNCLSYAYTSACPSSLLCHLNSTCTQRW